MPLSDNNLMSKYNDLEQANKVGLNTSYMLTVSRKNLVNLCTGIFSYSPGVALRNQISIIGVA